MVTVHEAMHERIRLGRDRVALHQNLDLIMNFPADCDYIWGLAGNAQVLVRTVVDRTGFSAVNYPVDGLVAFQFDAAPRRRGHRNGQPIQRPIPPRLLESWTMAKLDACGIDVQELEYRRFESPVSTSSDPLLFRLVSMMVAGVGTITDADKFSMALLHGIPGAGPKCWGYGTLMIT